MTEIFRYKIHEAREMALCDDGRWYCHDAGEPPLLRDLATMGEKAMAAEIKRLRAIVARINPTADDDAMDHMLHRLWTACVGTKEYDKESWREIHRQLLAAGIVR